MSNLQPDSLESFERLLSEQTSSITEVDNQIEKWTQFQNDYHQLNTRLSTLPDRLTYECMVPFGKLAFIPGRIIHSNELLVLLGDNYFVERSCKQAMDIVNRRLGNINENLRKYQNEKEMFNQQKNYTNNFLSDKTKFIEIKENDEEERKSLNRRVKLTDEEIREERRRLQERAMKMSETKTKHVHFEDNQMEIDTDDDDDDDIPNKRLRKIFIHHTKIHSEPTGDSSPALFSHPGAITNAKPVPFTGKTIEREITIPIEPPTEPPKRISKFKASRT